MNIVKTDSTFLIAEIAQAHDGSLGVAHSFIDALSETGVNAVKFQFHIASAESTSREPWRVKFSYADATRFDYWKRMEFSLEQWIGLKKHVEDKGMIFLCSPFSIEAVDSLNNIGIKAWKIGSGEIDNELMLEKILETKKPLIVSTGMSGWQEIDDLYQQLKTKKAEFSLLHCTTEYPVKPENFGLNILNEFIAKYDCPIGLSTHLPELSPSIAAIASGAKILEFHAAFSKYMFGPDATSSYDISEVKELVRQIRLLEVIIKQKVNKDDLAARFAETRAKFRKSIVASRHLTAGSKLELNDLAYKKPGDGLPVKDYKTLLGKKLKVDLNRDDLVTLNLLED